MENDKVVLRRGNRTLNLRHVDLNTGNLSRIFKLIPSTIFLVKECGDVLLPGPTGYFDEYYELAQCEVCGDEEPPSHLEAAISAPPVRQPGFTFMPRPTASSGHAGPPTPRPDKMYTRNILLGRVERGGLILDGASLIVEFSHQDATIPAMAAKIRRELRTDSELFLCDTQGNKLVESSGTTGVAFWRQNARKIVVLSQEHHEELQRRKKRKSGVTDEQTLSNMEELVLAAEELPGISKALQDLSQFARANKVNTIALTDDEVASVKATYRCIICREAMKHPVASSCCRSLIGCRICIAQWVANDQSCPRCRDQNFMEKKFEMTGMEETVQIFRETIRD